jgi:hypothetical protein
MSVGEGVAVNISDTVYAVGVEQSILPNIVDYCCKKRS